MRQTLRIQINGHKDTYWLRREDLPETFNKDRKYQKEPIRDEELKN